MKYLVILFILTLPLACSNNSESLGIMNRSDSNMDFESAMLESPAKVESKQDIDQKLIKESYLAFQTEDLDKSYQEIVAIVKKNNGYIQDDSADKGYNRISRLITLRIPTNNFQSAVDDISSTVDFFDSKRISSKDVTEEFIDLEARLKAKRTLEERYLDLLKKAKNVKEVLEIERELSKIREEIEAKQGRLKYLKNKVSLSTIQIQFYKISSETGVTKSYGSKMWNAIVAGFDGLSVFFLGILYIWPFILVVIIAFFIIRKWLAKRNKK
ncbi:DUF4349 domain-containing protein [Winogradskyella sp.]|uniref:DUF4349 domain-containing protein n=1 Tax=Winogradskyella sp. TaxID=1883156 RepID=UPI003F6C6161